MSIVLRFRNPGLDEHTLMEIAQIVKTSRERNQCTTSLTIFVIILSSNIECASTVYTRHWALRLTREEYDPGKAPGLHFNRMCDPGKLCVKCSYYADLYGAPVVQAPCWVLHTCVNVTDHSLYPTGSTRTSQGTQTCAGIDDRDAGDLQQDVCLGVCWGVGEYTSVQW